MIFYNPAFLVAATFVEIKTMRYLLLVMLLIPGISNAQLKLSDMEKNKAIIRKLYEESLNKRNLLLLKDFISEDYTNPQGKKGVAGFEENVLPLISAFPDVQWKIEELIGEGNNVVIRWTLHGTHTARFRNFAATHKSVTNDALAIYTFKEGKVISVYVLTDRLGFIQQLEAPQKDNVRFIDKFLVPAAAKQEFYERMRINRDFIKTLAGFVTDAAYERTDDEGNLICITTAVWENADALNKAREAVQAAYKKEGFNPAEMYKRLNITIDRGVYTTL
jgi:predicted ester cyclase